MTHPQDVPAPSPTVSEAMREAVALKIDPRAFSYGDPSYYGPDLMKAVYSARQRVALKTANDILAGPIASALAALERENATLRAERDDYAECIMALEGKVAALAPHGTCACSYDKPGEVCAHHAPALWAAQEEGATLRIELATLRASAERMEAVLKRIDRISNDPWPDAEALTLILHTTRAALTPKETPDA